MTDTTITHTHRIPLFAVREALHLAAARHRARWALDAALDLAGQRHELWDAIQEAAWAYETLGRCTITFRPQAVSVAA